MPRETLVIRQERVSRLLTEFARTYPEAHCELNYSTPLELLIATILSAQCTDKQVNIVTADLFLKYRTSQDYAAVALAELEQDIKRIGLFRNKARNIQACCRTLCEKFSGEVPSVMAELIELGGVGRKTANVVLGNAFGIHEGVVVDTHVARLSDRLRLSNQTSPGKIEADLQKLIPQKLWAQISHWLIWHGRRRCMARNPDCEHCEVKALCPSAFAVNLK